MIASVNYNTTPHELRIVIRLTVVKLVIWMTTEFRRLEIHSSLTHNAMI